MRVSRRRLLQVGVVGGAILWGGGVIRRVAHRAEILAEHRAALSSQGEEIVRAVAPIILGPLLSFERPGDRAALETGIETLDDYLAHLSLPVQEEARQLFAVLDLLPARLLLLGTTRSWRDVAPQDIERFLYSARNSRFMLLRRIHGLLQSLVVLAWFDVPVAWDAIGYPGPPEPRRLSARGSA